MTLVHIAGASETERPFEVMPTDDAVVRAMVRRGLFRLGISVAGVGILAAFAAVGAVGLVGQRCAELLPPRSL